MTRSFQKVSIKRPVRSQFQLLEAYNDQVVYWDFSEKNRPGRLIETGRSFVTRLKIEMDLVV